ncbi:MAG: glycosyltransferase family 4 protein [Anaerolineales bacterium]
MHILLIHQVFAALGEPGGTRHHEMARYLAAQGHRVTVITGQVNYLTGERTAQGWMRRDTDDSGVVIYRCYTYAAWHRSFFHRILSFISFTFSSFFVGLRVREVDLVWGTSPPIFQGLTAWALARLKRKPFLFEVRDLWPYFAIAVGVLRNRFLILLARCLERFLYHCADRLVINSPGFEQHVRERGARSVALVPNGVDVSMFDPADKGTAFRQEHGLEGKFVVMYAGAHGMSNDLGVVIGAADRLRDQKNVAFVLIGDGKEKSALMAKTAALRLSNVYFLPPMSKNNIAEALAAADACIAILKPIDAYKTTYPNKVFDYMAAGRPILLAIDGVIRSVVEKAGAGIFVRPGYPQALAGAVKIIESDPELRARMGKAGRKCAQERFDRQILAGKLAAVMTEVVGETNRVEGEKV